jgi:hypothetical protein
MFEHCQWINEMYENSAALFEPYKWLIALALFPQRSTSFFHA